MPMYLHWRDTPVVIGIADGRITYLRGGEPMAGRSFDILIVRADHPYFDHLDSAHWLAANVRTRLNPGGTYLRVTE